MQEPGPLGTAICVLDPEIAVLTQYSCGVVLMVVNISLLCSFQSAVSESNQHSEKGTLRVALFVEHQAQSSFNI